MVQQIKIHPVRPSDRPDRVSLSCARGSTQGDCGYRPARLPENQAADIGGMRARFSNPEKVRLFYFLHVREQSHLEQID
jgi:hypothetical protein